MHTALRTSFALVALGHVAGAQVPRLNLSVEWHGPTVASPDPQTGVPLTEGDLLVPTTGPYPAPGPPQLGPVFTPTVVLTHLAPGLGLTPGCVGHAPGTPCWVEVDAFSRAMDAPVTLQGVRQGGLFFSVDEYATGTPGAPPDVFSEAGPGEASADCFINPGPLPQGPLGPGMAPVGNLGAIDGDGYGFATGVTYPGSGLREPNPPGGGALTLGDDLDALDIVDPGPGFPLPLFSLDCGFPDPLTGVPGSGSAAVHGVSGGDVLLATPSGPPLLWAPAPLLGLDLVAGPDTDDLDALAVWDNGDAIFQASQLPNDWLTGGHDMVLFSVRRGSAVVGLPDSIFGLPIEPGDVLTAPLAGGASPYPGIYIAAENLNLRTARSTPFVQGDDLNALDFVGTPLLDCNANGIEDALEIVSGVALDLNRNGVPDACEAGIGTPYCFCTPAVAPCNNPFPTGGCLNASGGGTLMTGAGSTSVASDNLVLTTTGMNPLGFALTFYGTLPIAPMTRQNGLYCANGTNYRLPPYPTLTGTAALGPGIVAQSIAFHGAVGGGIAAGTTWQFQTWYRDVGGPCGSFSNFSNALSVTFTP